MAETSIIYFFASVNFQIVYTKCKDNFDLTYRYYIFTYKRSIKLPLGELGLSQVPETILLGNGMLAFFVSQIRFISSFRNVFSISLICSTCSPPPPPRL